MKAWLYFVICLCLISLGLWKFWSLGSIQNQPAQQFILYIDQPGVEIKRHGSEAWASATSGMVIFPGDAIHTDGEGNARLSVFGMGETRLGKKTDIVVQEVKQEQGIRINLQLQLGRIWTRLRRFTDLGDTYQVAQNGVIATVRGTAFDMQAVATGTQIWVAESAVSLEAKDTRHVILEGYMAKIKGDTILGKDEQITDADRQTEWFQKNQNLDRSFDAGYIAQLKQSYEKRGGAKPQTFTDGLTHLSEWMHMVIHPGKASEYYVSYTGRRLYQTVLLARDGKEGTALQEYAALEEDMLNHIKQQESVRPLLRHEIESISDILEDVTPNTPAYRLKQRIEDARIRFTEGDPLAQAHARLLAIEARLFEASNLIQRSSLDDADTALDAAKQGIENVTRDIEHAKGDVNKLDILRDKLQLLRMREGALRIRLATAISPPSSSASPLPVMASSTAVMATGTVAASSTAQATSSTAAALATSTVPTAPPEPPKPMLRTLQITPSNATLTGDQSVSYQAMAIYTDGTRKDVTDVCVLTASNLRLGFFLKNVFTANPGVDGQVDIVATYTESGKTVRGQGIVTVRN